MNTIYIGASPSLNRQPPHLMTPNSPVPLHFIREESASRTNAIETRIEPEIRLISNLSPRIPALPRFLIHQPPFVAPNIMSARNIELNPLTSMNSMNGGDYQMTKTRARENLIKDKLKIAGSFFSSQLIKGPPIEKQKKFEKYIGYSNNIGEAKNGDIMKTPARKVAAPEIYKDTENGHVFNEGDSSKTYKPKSQSNSHHKKSNSVSLLAETNTYNYNPIIEEKVRSCLERTNEALNKHSHFRNNTNDSSVDSNLKKYKNIEDLFSLSIKKTREAMQKHIKNNKSHGYDSQEINRWNMSSLVSEEGVGSRIESMNSSGNYLQSQLISGIKENENKSFSNTNGFTNNYSRNNMENKYTSNLAQENMTRSLYINDGEICLSVQLPDDTLLFEGFEENGKKCGFGVLKTQNGSEIYSGEWLDDLYNGQGYLYNIYCDQGDVTSPYEDFSLIKNSWVRYEGEFSIGKMNGIGGLFLTNGDHFYGEFAAGQVNGRGRYTLKDGKSFVANWKNNKLVLNS